MEKTDGMPQEKPSSLSSNLRHGGRSLLYAHPVARAETGLTCTNAAGHGFMISKEVQKLF